MSSGDFGEIDLAAEESDTRAVLLRLMDEFEAVARRAGAAAKHADDKTRIIGGELFQRSRSIVGDLEEFRPLGFGEPGKAADDRVVDEMRQGLF